jgi:hypothetical protein
MQIENFKTSQPYQIRKVIIVVLALIMGVGGISYFARGIYWAWEGSNMAAFLNRQGDDCDFQSRADEYGEFAAGVYPNVRVKRPDKPRAKHHTVYPPYALPMFGAFFGNWSFETARMVLQAGSLMALIAMTVYGANSLARYGMAAALLGAAIPWAFSGNRAAMSAGQFSIICTGLLVAQMHFQTKGRDLLAGAVWALAMIKPQIALPFAILFLSSRQMRGLAFGSVILAILSAFALLWTDFHLSNFLRDGLLSERLRFVSENSYSAGLWINALNISPRLAAAGAVLFLGALGLLVWFLAWRINLPILLGAAACSALGYSLFYHRRYDNMMLFPLALALVDFYFKRGFTKFQWIAFGAFFVSVFLPAGIFWKNETVPVGFALFAPILAVMVLMIVRFPFRDRKKEISAMLPDIQ